MSTLSNTERGPGLIGRRAGFAWPRLSWRGLLRWLVAYDARHRERATLAMLDQRILRDIGVTRADLDAALRRPDEHLRLLLLRGRH